MSMMDTTRQMRIAITRWTASGWVMARVGAAVRALCAGPVVAPAAVGVILIASACLVPAALHTDAGSTVYSVTQLRATLWHAPPRLAGQTVWVRGVLQSAVADPCAFTGGPCARAETQLTDPGAESASGLPVVLEPAGPLPTWVRCLPLVGTWLRRLPLAGLMNSPQQPRWGAIGLYQVRVQVQSVSSRAAAATLIAAHVELQDP